MTEIRRAGKRWRQNAPAHVVDVFDEPAYVDRYTVIVLPVMEYEGKKYVNVLGTSENLGFSGWREMELWEVAAFRYRKGHRRIAYETLPEKVRQVVEADV